MNDQPTGGTSFDEIYLVIKAPEMKRVPIILALDGGGVRGLSSLLILEKLMQEIQRIEGGNKLLLPCECFDLICGTSTGGLIAIMLGRLRMVTRFSLLLVNRIVSRCMHQKIYGLVRDRLSPR